MGQALELSIKPIEKSVADQIVKRYHYSGKVVQNSSLNFGVVYQGKLYGAMQFGSPTVKEKMLPLVKDSGWNDMLELNRMAFSDVLPRNSESRAISLAFKWMRKNAPHIKWVISFADGTQCVHGTIYQASNFVLSQIKKNTTLYLLPNGKVVHQISLRPDNNPEMRLAGISNVKEFLDKCYPGYKKLNGYMYRYIYFLDKKARKNYTGEIVPYSRIKELGIQMLRGQWVNVEDSEPVEELGGDS